MIPDHFFLRPEEAVLVVVDIQEKLAAVMPPDALAQVIKNTALLVQTAQLLEVPVLLTEQYRRGLGPTVEPLQPVLSRVPSIEKMTFSCWGEPTFETALKNTGRHDVLLCGMETHVCLLQTALDLLENQYHVFIPADALCSRAKANWKRGLAMMDRAGAVVGSSEIFIFQMLRSAAHPQFKAVSRLIK